MRPRREYPGGRDADADALDEVAFDKREKAVCDVRDVADHLRHARDLDVDRMSEMWRILGESRHAWMGMPYFLLFSKIPASRRQIHAPTSNTVKENKVSSWREIGAELWS